MVALREWKEVFFGASAEANAGFEPDPSRSCEMLYQLSYACNSWPIAQCKVAPGRH